MGFFDRFKRNTPVLSASPMIHKDYAVAANDHDVSLTFADREITFNGSLSGYNYRNILKSKQKNIQKLYELADYYCDADPLCRGIVKLVYVPYCMSDPYKLVGANERVKKKYIEYYKRIHLEEKLQSVYTSLIKYANCVVYLMDDGNIITLPIHYCRIANLEVNGEPLVQFNCMQVRSEFQSSYTTTQKDWIHDEEMAIRLKGYPKEIADGVMSNAMYVQLNPENTFVLQDSKEDWMRYAIPFISGCLIALEKKERISNYEDSLIDLAARSFVHVTYGDDKEEVLPTTATLSKIGAMFKSAMTGGALAVTNHHAKAVVVQPKTDDVFANEKYASVNNDILSAAGISGIIVNGSTTDGSSFASAQVSTATVAIRVQRFKDKVCEMMDKINARMNVGRMAHSAQCQIPRFTYPPVDLNGSKGLMESAKYLWENGLLSHESMMDAFGVDMMEQVERKIREEDHGIHEILAPSDKDDCQTNPQKKKSSGKRGRPTMDDSERTSDPIKSATGRIPKASNPQGSEPQGDVNTVV